MYLCIWFLVLKGDERAAERRSVFSDSSIFSPWFQPLQLQPSVLFNDLCIVLISDSGNRFCPHNINKIGASTYIYTVCHWNGTSEWHKWCRHNFNPQMTLFFFHFLCAYKYTLIPLMYTYEPTYAQSHSCIHTQYHIAHSVTPQAVISSDQRGYRILLSPSVCAYATSRMHGCRRYRLSLILLMPTGVWSSSVSEYVSIGPSLYISPASGHQK